VERLPRLGVWSLIASSPVILGALRTRTLAKEERMPIMTDTAARHALPNSPTSAHDELSKALLAADELTLRRLVADDCQIIGPKGFHILKEEWIGPHVGNVYELQSLDVLESTYAVHDQSAVIVDLQQSACVFRGSRSMVSSVS
jgi:hypothetical protein